MTAKPRRDFWQIWNLSFGFLGIQFALALQNSDLSRIFQTLGASIDEIPALWIAAPFTGLLLQPIVGYFSDRTWGRLGRRRPYLLIGAALSALALIIMCNATALWVAAAALWLLDGAINVSMGPIRALVGDELPPEQHAAGFAMQTFFIGAGAVVGSLLPWMLAFAGVHNSAPHGQIPDTVKLAFYIGAVAMLCTLGWTVFRTREYPPAVLAAFDEVAAASRASATVAPPLRRSSIAPMALGIGLLLLVAITRADPQLYLLGGGILAYGLVLFAAGESRSRNLLTVIITDLHDMPAGMRRLAVVQVFSWFALFAMWTYTTAAVTAFHFGATDPQSEAYNNGANWAGVLFAAYNGFAMLAAMFIPGLSARFGLRLTHLVNLLCGGLGLLSIMAIHDPVWLLLSMVGVGLAWASILTVPYALLSDAVPAGKMGAYIGIFNFFIVIPQLLAASVLGFLVKTFFADAPIYGLAIGGVSMLLAGLFTLRIPERSSAAILRATGVAPGKA